MLELMLPVFEAIEHSALGLSIRNAHTLYPLANVGHVLAVIVFFALVAAMDVAVLRRTLQEARETIWQTRKYAIIAFALVVISGAIMFIAEAGVLVKNLSFQLKAAAIMGAGVNLWMFSFVERRGWHGSMKVLSLASLCIWLFAAAAGRGIAYL